MSEVMSQKLKSSLPLEKYEVTAPEGMSPAQMQEALIATLYNIDSISSVTACEILQVSRREFEDSILSRYGFSTYRDDDSEADIELKAAGY